MTVFQTGAPFRRYRRIHSFRVHRPNWKAECGESRTLRLEWGKGCKALPIITEASIYPINQMSLSQIDYSKINPRHFYSSQSEKIKFNWFAFELACEIDRAVPYLGFRSFFRAILDFFRLPW